MRVLVCWIGRTDLGAAEGLDSSGIGPIAQALTKREFDRAVLLSNYPKKSGSGYVRWVKQHTTAKVTLRQVALEDPTDFATIYKLADEALGAIRNDAEGSASPLKLTLHISPGTPVMGAAWVILGKARYPAELIQTSREKGLRTTDIPLDIAAEFRELIPELMRGPDSSLEGRSGGTPPTAPQFGDIVYRSKGMAELVRQARRVAVRGVSVLIEGESGTGKELLARAIHQEGPRRSKPLLSVNCGALPKELLESQLFGHSKGAFTGAHKEARGYFQQASGGTLFLDEVGELPLDAQVKLLRVLQEKEVVPVGDTRPRKVDVRVIAATNRNLARECREGRFREDLFYRLAIAVLRPPPLRERKGDVGLLIDALLEKANQAGAREEPGYKRKKLSACARNLLLNHGWPGNVRELENTLMRATVWSEGGKLTEPDIRQALLSEPPQRGGRPLHETLGEGFKLDHVLRELSRQYIRQAIEQTEGNKSKAAELLGLNSRQTLTNRMNSLGLGDL